MAGRGGGGGERKGEGEEREGRGDEVDVEQVRGCDDEDGKGREHFYSPMSFRSVVPVVSV